MRLFRVHSIDERREMILHGGICRSLLTLSLPTIMMALVSSLIPVVDGYFMNHNASVAAAGAVGLAGPVINTLNSVSQGLSAAAVAILGQLNGRGEMVRLRTLASKIMMIAFGMGLVMAPVEVGVTYLLSGASAPDIAGPLFTYLALYSICLPFLFLVAVFGAIKNAVGQPESTLLLMILWLLMKLVFDWLFMQLFSLDVVGAVLASFFSFLFISSWMFYDLYLKDGDLKLPLRGNRVTRRDFRELMRIGLPTILSSAMINLGFFLINLEVAKFGSTVLNAQAIAANINAMCFALPASISVTVTTMVSMSVSAGDGHHARQVFFWACALSLSISALMIAIFMPAAPWLVRLFRPDNPEIIAVTERALNIYTLSIVGFGIFMVVSGAYIGLGRTKMPLVAGFLRIWLLRIVFIKLTVATLGVDAIFWGNLFANYLAAILFFLLILRVEWKSVIEESLERF